MRLLCASIFVLFFSVGCTVSSRWGTRELPADLRSSADREKPFIASDAYLATAPAAAPDLTPESAIARLDGSRGRNSIPHLRSPVPGERRREVVVLSSNRWGRLPPYTNVYQALARFDPDPLVRATAIRALNRSRDDSARTIFLVALRDGHPQVRLEAVKALANQPVAQAEPMLRQLSLDGSQSLELRTFALDALRHARDLETKRLLVDQLVSPSFPLAWQARRSLYLMTGQDFRYDQGKWLESLTRS